MNKDYIVAAYYFPNYHQDTYNAKIHGEGWNEWNLLKKATPRFEGHQQPKVPLWGYEDESNPKIMEKKIDTAISHNVNTFIFDWYWYDDGPYLEKCLNEGFLKAKNNDKMNFSLMWANHDWISIFPDSRVNKHKTLRIGATTEESFRKVTDYVIENYFSHPSHLKVDGGHYFSIYSLSDFIKGFGSMEKARQAVDEFRQKTRDKGLGEIHLNAVIWGKTVLPCETVIEDTNEVLDKIGFDSVTSYVWFHHHALTDFPQTSYSKIREEATNHLPVHQTKYKIPYYPNVSMGWDPSPRTTQSDLFEDLGYPYTGIMDGNTPEEFKKAVKAVKEYLDNSSLNTKMFTINAWNEWTEGSYLEPDVINKYGYLEAIRDVMGEE